MNNNYIFVFFIISFLVTLVSIFFTFTAPQVSEMLVVPKCSIISDLFNLQVSTVGLTKFILPYC